MKKILILVVGLLLTVTLAGCTKEVEVPVIEYVDRDVEVIVEVPIELADIPATLRLDDANFDDFLGRPDVQYVDLRNFDDKMNAGYVAGFEFIPFFDYLEYSDILVRDDGLGGNDWIFAAAEIMGENALRALFNEDKTIFLMCGSGTRAGYVKDALDSLGYTDVINVGGTMHYDPLSVNWVAGDSMYKNQVSTVGGYTPGTYLGYDPVGGYNATVTIGEAGGIVNVFFDAAYGDSTKQDLGFDYHMKQFSGGAYEWFEHANMLSDFIVSNQGWDGITLIEDSIEGLNALTVGHHFINIDNANSPDAIAGVTIGAEGFVLAWNAAIMQATEAGTMGVVATTATAADWAYAHMPAIPYMDGEYTGFYEGYSATVRVSGGAIVDVFLDTLNGDDVDEDGIDEVFTPKQSLTMDDYPMNWDFANSAMKVSEYLLVTVAGLDAGEASYATQIFQEGFAVTETQEYTITFDAYAGEDRQMNVNFGDALDVEPWFTEYMDTAVIDLTTELQTFTIVFTMAEATTVDQGKLVFELGEIAGAAVNTEVYIDNVMIEESVAGVVTADTDMVVNGDFSNGLDSWGGWFGDQYAGFTDSTMEIETYTHLSWWEMAEALADAIVDEQTWVWDVNDDGYFEGKGDYFADTDGVAGVTLHVDKWEMAVKEALEMAWNPTGLMISEYIEGSGNNKALEIYNYTDAEISLFGYSIVEHYNTTGSNQYFLEGTLGAGEVLVICTDQIDTGTLLETNCDIQLSYPSVVHFNGDDAVQLLWQWEVIDVIGDPALAGGDDFAKDVTLVRIDLTGGSLVFDPLEWTEYAQNTYDYIGTDVE